MTTKADELPKQSVQIGTPPNIEEIHKLFPTVIDNPYVVFTYYPHIYKRVDAPLPEDLLIHEATHLAQQEFNPPSWWDSYLTRPEFRLEQEVEAYGNQLAFAKLRYSNRFVLLIKGRIADDLSSEVYGGIIGRHEAETKIRKYAETVDKDTLKALAARITLEGVDEGGKLHTGDEQGIPESSD